MLTVPRLHTRKVARSAAALALAVPLTVASVAAPASASSGVGLVDHWSGYGYPGYGYLDYGYPGYGYPSYGSPAYGYRAPSSVTGSTAGLNVSDATKSQSAGLVEITTTVDYDAGEAAGTGIILSSDGLVVTNHHVVEGATDITVTDVATGATYTADVLGYDSVKDVAVLQLEDASGLTPVTTDTSGTAVGETITAVGDAGGDGGDLTTAPGTVTALGETITVTDDQTGADTKLRRLIENTSDVVPGDSGGALQDADGDVVGMNVAASSGSTSDQVDGYAIPMARVLRVVDQVTSDDDSGHVVLGGGSAFLGVQLSTTDTSTTLAGVVADSPASDLGLASGDSITAVGGTPVATAGQLRSAVASHKAGDTIAVTWTDSSGTSHSRSLTLTTGPVG